jgi:hypothetical protein
MWNEKRIYLKHLFEISNDENIIFPKNALL